MVDRIASMVFYNLVFCLQFNAVISSHANTIETFHDIVQKAVNFLGRPIHVRQSCSWEPSGLRSLAGAKSFLWERLAQSRSAIFLERLLRTVLFGRLKQILAKRCWTLLSIAHLEAGIPFVSYSSSVGGERVKSLLWPFDLDRWVHKSRSWLHGVYEAKNSNADT